MTVRLPSFSKMKCPHLRRLADQVGLVLASGSPRRRTILKELGLKFEIIVPSIREEFDPALSPAEQAIELARQKAASLKIEDQRCYLSCDTVVFLDGKFLDKPRDRDEAFKILKTLSGRTHSVITGLALRGGNDGRILTGFEESRVSFNELEDRQINEYIATGEPMDKAGAYGIQGMGGFLVDTVDGNIDNVIGLPVGELECLVRLFLENYDR